jgi:K(+)-stimulated pyrophosphate-energized sodium pump
MIEALPVWFWLAPIGAVAALVVALMFYLDVMSKSEGTPRMIEISQAVREGAMAYLGRQYRVIAIVFAILFVIFLGMALVGLQNIIVPFTFLIGGLLSGITGYIGMRTATSANARTAQAASESLNGGLQVAFRAGAVMGLSVVGLALLNIILLFLGLYFLVPPSFWGADSAITQITAVVLASSVGASTMALFARVGGGIYTKAADVGADLVGKVEANIPEDDPRNPAVIADNVGDNVGDVAGMGADLYESYAGAIVAAMALGVSAFAAQGLQVQLLYLTLPLAIAGMGAILSVVGMFLVRTEEGATMGQIIRALDFGIQGAAAGIAVLSLPLIWLMGLDNPVGLWLTIVIGLAVGIIIGWATEYFTSGEHEPTQTIVTQGGTGPATVIIQGLAVGMESTMLPVITVGLGLLLSYMAAGGLHRPILGLYGVSLAAVGMLSTLGITLATDAYGPIADNAGGNAEMANLPPEVRGREGLPTRVLFEIPVIGGWTRRSDLPGPGSPRGTKISGSERRAGAVRRYAPGGARARLVGAGRTPWERRISTRSADSASDRPWGAGPKELPHGGTGGRKRAGGIAATPVAAAMRKDVLRRGTPRGRGQGGAATPRPGAGLRAIRRRGVFLHQTLRAGGAKIPAAMDREGCGNAPQPGDRIGLG